MFSYLTIEQAIKYVSSKVEYEFLFDNLKDLEAFQIINPVFFFKGFAKFQYSEIDGTSEIGGYFCLNELESLISKQAIPFGKCFLSEPNLEYYDSFSDTEVSLNIGKDAKESEIVFKWIGDTDSMEVNPYHYNFHLYTLDEDGNELIKSLISPQDVRIKKCELDQWLTGNKPKNNSDAAQDRIRELEQQQAPQRTRAQTDEANTDKKLIAMLAILLAKQSNTFRIGDRPNAKQINEQVYNLTMQIVEKLGMDQADILGLKANTDKISKAVQAYADMFKLSKD